MELQQPKSANLLMGGHTKTWPVVEVFGSVIQGEGHMIGEQTMFVRFGGCDFRCKWCDSLHAVLPAEVKKNSTPMHASQIVLQMETLSHCRTVTLSGGNPCIHDLSELIDALKIARYYTAVETQGTVWNEWVKRADIVTISPKGPSSGMEFDGNALLNFIRNYSRPDRTIIKVVVFNEADYEFACNVYEDFGREVVEFYLQPGTDVMDTENDAGADYYTPNIDIYRNAILARTRWLTELATKDKRLRYARIIPQVHALVYGHKQGV